MRPDRLPCHMHRSSPIKESSRLTDFPCPNPLDSALPISENFGGYGSDYEQLRGVPDGTKFVIKVKQPSVSLGDHD